jgi:mersacidin/lichenicidin family type 2 lantibiotic
MNSNIVRAWKDEFYRQSLSDEERAQLPENPVGELELTEAELEGVFGGFEPDEHMPIENSYYVNCFTHNRAFACMHQLTMHNCYTYPYNVCHHITYSALRECYPYEKTTR